MGVELFVVFINKYRLVEMEKLQKFATLVTEIDGAQRT
jgi:hypothetical protein